MASLVSKGNDAPSGASTTLVSTAANHTSGNTLIICVTSAIDGTISTITDTAGNTYIDTGATTNDVGTGLRTTQWYAKNIIGNASNVITVTYGSSLAGRRLSWLQYSGLDKDNPLDKISTGTGTGTSMASTAVSTSQANEVLVAVGRVNSGAISAGSGYTMENQAGANANAQEDQIVTTRGSYAGEMTCSLSVVWSASLTTWRVAQTRQLAALGVG